MGKVHKKYRHCAQLQANKDKDNTPPRDAPPPTPITKGLNLTGTPIVRKEKRQSSARYNASKNCELTALSPLTESEYNQNTIKNYIKILF